MNEKYIDLLHQTTQYSINYIKNIDTMEVFPKSLKELNHLEQKLPQKGSKAKEVIQFLNHIGANTTTAMLGGRYYGFVNGGLLPVAHAAQWLTDTWNQNSALYAMSPFTSKLEEVCEMWLVELLGLQQGTAAGFVTGSSNAILCALAAARNTLYQKQGYDIIQKGMKNAPQIKVVFSEDIHSTVKSALTILGFGQEDMIMIPTNEYGIIDLKYMPTLDSKTLVIIQAGNVNGGAFDPIDEICNLANKAGAWIHIDGAFGLWAAASKKQKHWTEGIEKADSCSTDAHKTLNAGYDCGIVFCKHRKALTSALMTNGAYIPYGEQRDNMLYTTEMSRRARSIAVWAVLKHLGKEGVEQLIDSLCDYAEYFAQKLVKCGFHLVIPVCFNQFLIQCDTDENTKKVLQIVQNSGVCWCGESIWKGKTVIRISICSHATTYEDIDKSVSVFQKAIHQIKQ